MSYLDNLFGDAKEEANRICTLDFNRFEGYREIAEDDLPADQFYEDEWKQQLSVRNKSMLAPAVLLIAGVVLFVVWLSNPAIRLLIFFSVILLAIGIYSSILVYKRSQGISSAGYSCRHIGRGVILCRTRVVTNAGGSMTRGALSEADTINTMHNRAVFHFVSVFFPETKTYIRNVFCSDGGLRKPFRIGDTVVVYRHSDSGQADLLPSAHVVVPPELKQVISVEQLRKPETTKVKVTTTSKKTLVIMLIVFLVVLLIGMLPFLLVLILALLKVPITFQ